MAMNWASLGLSDPLAATQYGNTNYTSAYGLQPNSIEGLSSWGMDTSGLTGDYSSLMNDSNYSQGFMQQLGSLPMTDKLQTGTSTVSALTNAYGAYQNTQLAQDQYNFQKDAWTSQWNANKQTVNSSLEDRQKARVASNANAYESVDSYMNKYGVK